MTALTKLFLLLILLTSLTAETYGQNHGIYHVKFDLYHSRRIPNHHVSVVFQRFGDSILVNVKSEPMNSQSEEWNKTKLNYSFVMIKSEFDKVVETVQKINCKDIVTGLDFTGHDGTHCEISYGGISTGISYDVWTPGCETNKRNLEEFLEACKLILITANFDPEEIL